jgi:SAM-dependent methyltransferase
VLDVGCGRGLLLIGAAKRLKSGRATGVDLWQAEDLSGNRPDVPLKNAALEGVAERVVVETADMRRLPFPDASFDVVVSRAAIHNLYKAPDRAAAIREIARALKPGASAVISDIRHHPEYVRTSQQSGCKDTVAPTRRSCRCSVRLSHSIAAARHDVRRERRLKGKLGVDRELFCGGSRASDNMFNPSLVPPRVMEFSCPSSSKTHRPRPSPRSDVLPVRATPRPPRLGSARGSTARPASGRRWDGSRSCTSP